MKKRILIVDDDMDELFIFKEAFSKLPYDISHMYADSCEKALKILKADKPDYIFMDVNMPKTDGFECLKNIKGQQTISGIPVIIFSSGKPESIESKALQLGALSCYKKEDSVELLSRHIAEILEKE